MDKEHFEKRVKKIESTGCWEWQGARSNKKYGQVVIGKDKIGAHRYSYELYNHKEIGDLFVCHKCDNPPCVNPDHLFLGTNSDNMKDCFKKGRLHNLKNKFLIDNIPLNKKYSDEEILKVFDMIKNNPKRTIISICKELDINYQTIKDARRKNNRCYKKLQIKD